MTDCELNIKHKRCEECIRPLCQRKLIDNINVKNKWQDIDITLGIRDIEMHSLYMG